MTSTQNQYRGLALYFQTNLVCSCWLIIFNTKESLNRCFFSPCVTNLSSHKAGDGFDLGAPRSFVAGVFLLGGGADFL